MMHTSYGMRKESEAANFETGKPNSHGHGQFGNIVDEKHERQGDIIEEDNHSSDQHSQENIYNQTEEQLLARRSNSERVPGSHDPTMINPSHHAKNDLILIQNEEVKGQQTSN